MKKIFVLILILALISVVFIGCTNKEDDFSTINVMMPDGAPALVIAKLLHDNPKFEGYKVNYEIVSGAEGIKAKMLSGEADIAILPTNMAAALYNVGKDIKIVASNAFGLLYMLGKEDINSLEDLKGKVVYNIGQGQTPDFVFKTVLDQNEIKYDETDSPKADEVGLRYAANPQNLISLMLADKVEYAILGEPQVSQAVNSTGSSPNSFKIIVDLQEEWVNGYPQVSTVAKGDLIKDHAEFLDAFLAKLEENIAWITENPELVKTALQNNGSNLNFIDVNSIARCNIRFEPAAEIKESIDNYLQLMYNFDKGFVGGKLPDEGLYYI